MTMAMVPVSRNEAKVFIEKHHSHHHAPGSWEMVLVAGAAVDGKLVCVGVAGRPKARLLCLPGVVEITRIASDGTTKNVASFVISHMARALLALGHTRIVSYTLLGEAGTSYRAAGWHVASLVRPGNWSSGDRVGTRNDYQPGWKVRWEFGPEAAPRDQEAEKLVMEAIGAVDVPPRPSQSSLFD